MISNDIMQVLKKPRTLWAISFLIVAFFWVVSLIGYGQELHSTVTLISLFATFPAVVICYMVLDRWNNEYHEYCTATEHEPSQLLIAGVYLGFCGSLIDNTWWGLAWSFHYLWVGGVEMDILGKSVKELKSFFFDNGVFSNTLFRQGALIWAGILHIHADTMSRSTPRAQKAQRKITVVWIKSSCLVATVFVAGLMILKYLH